MKKNMLVAPKCRKLNLGAGKMLLKGYFNFDRQRVSHKAQNIATNSPLGDIKKMRKIFRSNWFDEIVCFHVIEHFYLVDAKKVLKDSYALLRKGGVAIFEAPDVIQLCKLFMDKPSKLIMYLFGGGSNPLDWVEFGESYAHKYGWTGDLLAEEMKKVGFKIRYIGEGVSHQGGFHPPESKGRDFRVEGVK